MKLYKEHHFYTLLVTTTLPFVPPENYTTPLPTPPPQRKEKKILQAPR